jgi:UDP-N-acetylmuramate dehydrogenase
MMAAHPQIGSEGTIMHGLEDFAEIIQPNEPLAPYTYLRVGGPAEFLVRPRSRDELAAIVQACSQKRIAVRVLGGGCNVLVPDEGVRGAVLRLTEPAFTEITVTDSRIRAGAGAMLSALISQAARHGLGGLESLVGIPGTVGGAIRCNAGERSGEIGRFVRQVEVLDASGRGQMRERDELDFTSGGPTLDDPVMVAAEFELEHDSPDHIVKHMRKAWIQRKARQPLSFQASARIFRNPRGLSAAALIEQAGLAKIKVGGAEISDRDANFIITQEGAAARDVLRLIDLVRTRVRERFHTELELEITVW